MADEKSTESSDGDTKEKSDGDGLTYVEKVRAASRMGEDEELKLLDSLMFGETAFVRALADQALAEGAPDEYTADATLQAQGQQEILGVVRDQVARADGVTDLLRAKMLDEVTHALPADERNQLETEIIDAVEDQAEMAVLSGDPVAILRAHNLNSGLGGRIQNSELTDALMGAVDGVISGAASRTGTIGPGASPAPTTPDATQQPGVSQPGSVSSYGTDAGTAGTGDGGPRTFASDVDTNTDTYSGPMGGGESQPGSQPTEPRPAWEAAADDLGKGETSTDPGGVSGTGSRTSEPTSPPSSIGPLPTNSTDIPAAPTSPTLPAASKPTNTGGVVDDTDFEAVEVGKGVLGFVWVDDGEGGMTAIDPDTGQPVGNVAPVQGSESSDTGGEANPNAGTTDDDNDSNSGDGSDDGSEDGSEETDSGTSGEATAYINAEADTGTFSGIVPGELGIAVGHGVLDGRITTIGRPELIGIGPDIGNPDSVPSNPGDEAPQGDTMDFDVIELQSERIAGFGITTIRPELIGIGPEIDPSHIPDDPRDDTSFDSPDAFHQGDDQSGAMFDDGFDPFP